MFDKVSLANAIGGQVDAPFGSLTTYRVGGSASVYVEVDSIESLEKVGFALNQHPEVPIKVIGAGSNMLVSDNGFDGLVLKLINFDFWERTGNIVSVGGTAMLPVVARQVSADSLSGLEWGVGVPGSVGGAIRMNAGGHGSSISSSLETADIFSFEDGYRIVNSKNLDYGYRTSNIKPNEIVLAGTFVLNEGEPQESKKMLSEIVKWRRANQPGGQNGGSVFTNPTNDSAGRLIQDAGLKGYRIGTAEVSPKHANFIQVDSGGKSKDVHRLIQHIQEVVWQTHEVMLTPENHLVGF